MDGSTVTVAVVSSRPEADLIVGLLESHGVHASALTDDAGGQEPQWQLAGVRGVVGRSDGPLAPGPTPGVGTRGGSWPAWGSSSGVPAARWPGVFSTRPCTPSRSAMNDAAVRAVAAARSRSSIRRSEREQLRARVEHVALDLFR